MGFAYFVIFMIPALMLLVLFLFSYLVGSLPLGSFVSREAGYPAAEHLLDAIMGAAVVFLLAKFQFPSQLSAIDAQIISPIAAFGVLIGRMRPFLQRGEGGKGAGTFVGVVFALFWPYGLVFCAIWLLTALLCRSVSLSTLIATATVVLAAVGMKYIPSEVVWRNKINTGPSPYLFLALAALLFWSHRMDLIYFFGDRAKRYNGDD